MDKRPVLLIDSNALIHRAYHAYPRSLATQDGKVINAAFGFLSIVLQVIDKFEPSEIYFAFDSKGKTFRHEKFPEYKATRKKTDEELVAQFPLVKDLLKAGEFKVIELPGYEADDIIGTISVDSSLKGKKKIIVTGDGDLLQLINSEVNVFLSGSTFQKSRLFDLKTAKEKLGYTVEQVIEYKGLRGDTSDNIPGVAGIGDISAKKLLERFRTIDEIFKNIEKVEPGPRNKLEKGLESAYMSRELATVDTKAPIDISHGKSLFQDIDFKSFYKHALGLEFKSLLPKILKLESKYTTDLIKKERVSQGLGNVDNSFDSSKTVNENSVQDLSTVLDTHPDMVVVDVRDGQQSYSDVVILFGRDNVFSFNSDTEEYINLWDKIAKNKITVIAFNSKNLHKLHLKLGIKTVNIDFDLSLAAYLLSGSSIKLDFESLCLEYLDEVAYEVSDEIKMKKMAKLYKVLKDKIGARNGNSIWNIKRLLYEVEIPLSLVLAKMELSGIRLDQDYLRNFEVKLSKLISEREEKIFKKTSTEFNLASPKQLGEVLFEKMKLPGGKKGKNGRYSTNEKILKNLEKDFDVVKDILEYREFAKLKSTYTTTLIKQVDPKTERIHSQFRQDVTATGRLSSVDPNLQNIPISTELGQEVRRAFVAEKNSIFLFLDYSQQELRLLADLSGEENLAKAFREDVDIHSLTASRLLHKSLEDVTKSDRRIGKTVNFGIVYGISAFGLSDRLQIDNSVGAAYIESFFKTYPKVRVYFDELIKKAYKEESVSTIAGRLKKTSGLKSNIYMQRKAVEREILNFPLQGSAADMIKIAMVRIQEKLEKDYGDYARLVLQVHDELVFEVKDDKDSDRLKQLAKDMSDLMLGIFDLSVPMKVDIEFGKNLADRNKLLLD